MSTAKTHRTAGVRPFDGTPDAVSGAGAPRGLTVAPPAGAAFARVERGPTATLASTSSSRNAATDCGRSFDFTANALSTVRNKLSL